MNAKEVRRRETELAEKIINGENVTENTGELYTLLMPMYRGIIRKYGNEIDNADIMQEMYFALLNALDFYKTKTANNEKYVFTAVVYSLSSHAAINYLKKYYSRFYAEDGKQYAHTTHMGAISYNVKVGYENGAKELQDLLPDKYALEDEVIQRENDREQETAASALWREVDTLPQQYRNAVIDRFKKGFTSPEIATREGITQNVAKNRVARGLKILLKNGKIREIAPYYIPSLAYRVGYGFFDTHRTSSTEYIVLKKLEREEAKRTTYKLIDPSIVEGKRLAVMARYTGLSVTTLQRLGHEKGIYRDSAVAVANYFRLPFEEVFEVCVEAPPKKVRAYAPRPSSCYTLAREDVLNGYKRNKTFVEKAKDLNISIDTIESSIKLLQRGGKAQKKSAERLAVIFEKPFEDLFKVA